MPYVYYEELPEGSEGADVVSRSDYDTAISERDQYAQQRDDALTQIEEANKEAREARAKYAQYILDTNSQSKNDNSASKQDAKPVTINDLWR